MNLTPATVKSSHADGVDVVLPGGGVTSIPVEPRNATPGVACTVGFRPETLTMAAEGPLGGKGRRRWSTSAAKRWSTSTSATGIS